MSPRTGPRRPYVGVRVGEGGLAWLDSEAERRGLLMASGRPNRSEMIRLALAYAQQRMPSDWKPKS